MKIIIIKKKTLRACDIFYGSCWSLRLHRNINFIPHWNTLLKQIRLARWQQQAEWRRTETSEQWRPGEDMVSEKKETFCLVFWYIFWDLQRVFWIKLWKQTLPWLCTFNLRKWLGLATDHLVQSRATCGPPTTSVRPAAPANNIRAARRVQPKMGEKMCIFN